MCLQKKLPGRVVHSEKVREIGSTNIGSTQDVAKELPIPLNTTRSRKQSDQSHTQQQKVLNRWLEAAILLP